MTHFVIAASSLLAVALAVALLREVRLRKALQRLLAKIFNTWKHANENDPPARPSEVEPADADSARDGRLQ